MPELENVKQGNAKSKDTVHKYVVTCNINYISNNNRPIVTAMTISKLLFHGKTAVITGAGGGLGRVYAIELSKRGANVVVNDIPPRDSTTSAADSLVKYINENGGKAISSHHDVIDGNEIINDAINAYGKVDILINNAGILRDKSFHKMTKKEWYDVINIHLNGTFELCHSVWPHMQQQNYGRIINVGSGAGLYGNFGQSNYSAAKMGILGLSNTLAIEGSKYNINVNCIVPVAASKMTENIIPSNVLQLLKPEHISPLVTYLSHENCKESGSIYELGAGWYSKVRLQRSLGLSLGNKSHIASAEEIMTRITDISDFTQSSNPTTLAGSLGDMIDATSRPISTSTSNRKDEKILPNQSSGIEFKTDRLFSSTRKVFMENPERAAALVDSINARICISIKNSSSTDIKEWYIDLRSKIPSIEVTIRSQNDSADHSDPNRKPDVKLYCTDDVFMSLAAGATSPEMAVMKGNLKIKGPLNIATRIRSLLEVTKNILAEEKI